MLSKLSPPQLQFLSRLGKNPDFAMLQAIFSQELSSHDEKCRSLDGPALYRAQGVSAWLVSFAEKVQKADEELQRTARTAPVSALRTANA